ncbi:MAG TPA: hypothetical protein DDW17_07550 [Deltaproteobacteria bacterium]|nr:hypothetical protein [Deltaproteobacteria bacterium]
MSETSISYGVKRDQPLNRWKENSTVAFMLVVVLAFIAAFSFQGARGLYETTEGRYAEAAREMVETGNYLVPTLDYQPHWTKPPLAYWGIAMGILLFGRNEFGVRFSNSLAFLIVIIIVTILGALLWDRKVGLTAGLIYLSSPFPFFGANAVSTDTLLTLWELCAVLSYFKAYNAEESKRKSTWVMGMWFFFGLGFLTKGPPSLLPLIPILVWNYTGKTRVALLKGLGIPLFFFTGFSWFILITLKNPHLFNYFLKTEIVNRVSSTAVHNSEWYGPFTVYLPVLLAGQGVWLYFSARGFWKLIRSGPKHILTFMKQHEEILFLVLWIIIPLLIFSISRSRLELYVLPLYAPITLLVACWITRYEGLTWKRLAMIGTVSIILLVVFKLGIAYTPNKNDMKQVYTMVQQTDSRNAEYFVFDEDKLYGMQFYLNGIMQRVTRTGGESWAATSMDNLLLSIREKKLPSEHLILVRRKKVPLVRDALVDAGLNVQEIESKYWIWFRITTGKL